MPLFTVSVTTLVSDKQGLVPVTVYKKVLFDVPIAGVNIPVVPFNVPPDPKVLVQIPPVCSFVIKENKLIGVVSELQIVVAPSDPALGCATTETVT